MEAVPRLHMLWFPSKSSPEGTSFLNLKQYIAEFYQEDADAYTKEVLALETLRNQALNSSKDKCTLLKRYYCQLHSLQNRFPQLLEKSLFTFTWKQLYGNKTQVHNDLRYEQAAVLFNISAAHTQVGASVIRSEADGMKLACTHFQCAAWSYGELRERYASSEKLNDDMLTNELLVFMQQVCYAQAQECILEKSLIDNRKPNIVAKVTAQIVAYYGAALAALLTGGADGPVAQIVGSSVYKLWKKYIRFKISYLNCILYLYQGQHAEEQKKMGERVTLYEAAWEKLEEAHKASKGLPDQKEIMESLNFTADVVEAKLKNAKSENEFIYHEAVPELRTIAAVQGANLVNGISFSTTDPEVAGNDIFARLVPMKAHEASSLYSEEKAKLLRKYGAQIEEKDNELENFMSSLILENLNINEEKANKIPQGIIDRCAALNSQKNTIPDLIKSMANLADVCSEVESNLNDIGNILSQEDKEEREFQQLSGVQRTPNAHITELSREYQKYKDAHHKAGESNDTLRKAMELHINNLKILSKPWQEIQQSVPKLSSELNTAEIFKDVKLIVNKVNEMKAQRSQFHADLRIAVNEDDITSKVIAQSDDEGLQSLFTRELAKHERLTQLIDQNLMAQGNILKALTESYAKAAPILRTLADVKHKRESFFNSLAASYDVYEDLLGKSAKGLEFYGKLSANIQKLLSRCKSARDVQSEERQQRLLGVSSKTINNIKTSNINSDIYISNNSKANETSSISNAPKLIDYLKNKTNGNPNQTKIVNSKYIPLIRPNPLGSENPTQEACSGKSYFPNNNTNVAITPVVGPNEPPPPYTIQQMPFYNPKMTGYTNPMYVPYQQNSVAPPAYKPQASPNSQMTNLNTSMTAMNLNTNSATVPHPEANSNYSPVNVQNSKSMAVIPSSNYSPNLVYTNANSTSYQTNVANSISPMVVPPTTATATATATNVITNIFNTSSLATSHSNRISNVYGAANNQLVTQSLPQQHYNVHSSPQSYPTIAATVANSIPQYAASAVGTASVFAGNQSPLSNKPQYAYHHGNNAIAVQQYAQQQQQQSALQQQQQPALQQQQQQPQQQQQFQQQQPPLLQQHQQQQLQQQLEKAANLLPQTMPVQANISSTGTGFNSVNTQTHSIATPAAANNTNAPQVPFNNMYPGYAFNTQSGVYNTGSGYLQSATANAMHQQQASYNREAIGQQYAQQTALNLNTSNSISTPLQASIQSSANNMINNKPPIDYYNPPYNYSLSNSSTPVANPNPIPNSLPTATKLPEAITPSASITAQCYQDKMTINSGQQIGQQYQQQQQQEQQQQQHQQQHQQMTSGNVSNIQSNLSQTNQSSTIAGIKATASNSTTNTISIANSSMNATKATASATTSTTTTSAKSTTFQTNLDLLSGIDLFPMPETDALTPVAMQPMQPLQPEPVVHPTANSATAMSQSAAELALKEELNHKQENVEAYLAGQPSVLSMRSNETSAACSPIDCRKSSLDNLSSCSDLTLDHFDWDSVSVLSDKQPGKQNSLKDATLNNNTFLMHPYDPFQDDKILKYFHKEVERFEKLIESLNVKMLNGHTPLSTKWQELQKLLMKEPATARTTTIARLFPDKNRSLDCLPYDHARVKLDKETDDYINAAYIKNLGTGCPNMIIAQTPQSNTNNDFWFMLWSQKARTVLCLHPANELLDPYWPQTIGTEMNFDDFSVKCEKITTLSHCIEYQLKLSMLHSDAIIELAILQIKNWRKTRAPGQILGIGRNALAAHQQRCLAFKTATSPLVINCLTGSERSGLVAVSISTILATQQKRPILTNVVDVWHRINCQRQQGLRDIETLELSMQIVLTHAHDILNKRGILTSYQMKIAPQAAEEEEQQANKDPLNELDALWKLK